MTELMQQVLENREHHFDTWEELEGFVNGDLMGWWDKQECEGDGSVKIK